MIYYLPRYVTLNVPPVDSRRRRRCTINGGPPRPSSWCGHVHLAPFRSCPTRIPPPHLTWRIPPVTPRHTSPAPLAYHLDASVMEGWTEMPHSISRTHSAVPISLLFRSAGASTNGCAGYSLSVFTRVRPPLSRRTPRGTLAPPARPQAPSFTRAAAKWSGAFVVAVTLKIATRGGKRAAALVFRASRLRELLTSGADGGGDHRQRSLQPAVPDAGPTHAADGHRRTRADSHGPAHQ
jgi:hypothetical protein